MAELRTHVAIGRWPDVKKALRDCRGRGAKVTRKGFIYQAALDAVVIFTGMRFRGTVWLCRYVNPPPPAERIWQHAPVPRGLAGELRQARDASEVLGKLEEAHTRRSRAR